MITCGLKFTHDAGIAVFENNKLISSVEIEKFNNNPRFSELADTELIVDVLDSLNLRVKDIDSFVVDGWEGTKDSKIRYKADGISRTLQMAPYIEEGLNSSILERNHFSGLEIDGHVFDYSSYMHVAGHVLSAYCSSPFALQKEDSFVLVWDGGMFPRLYYVNAKDLSIENLGSLFYIMGNCYSLFAMHFNPFIEQRKSINANLSIAGKVMAYIAHGEKDQEIINELEYIYQNHLQMDQLFPSVMASTFIKRNREKNYREEDVLTSLHYFLEEKLLSSFKEKLKNHSTKTNNLAYAGGCALNIKWNSSLRNSGMFKEVWVPPFPNDSGSAIGAACCELFTQNRILNIDWDVYSGPQLAAGDIPAGWKKQVCTVKELAKVLHAENEPVVFLDGKAELGPRALGNRSIIASPASPSMKTLLNEMKKREQYRPIAPICIEESATEVFEPGISDRYMLFDHKVRPAWQDKVAAIMHLDGTSRVQTVSADSNPLVYELLTEFNELSGIPVLTNTSANYNGKGFFPDIASAAEWGKAKYLWNDGYLYLKQ